MTRTGKRIVVTTYGSFGDIHPYIPLALELKARGHHPIFATSGVYREKIESLGIDFHAVRPDLPSPDDHAAVERLMKEVIDAKRGGEYIFKKLLMPYVRESYEDLSHAAHGADLIITHVLTYAGHMLAQKMQVSWVSTILAPMQFFSIYDPPVPPQWPWLAHFFRLGPSFASVLGRVGKHVVAGWAKPVYELRSELGLPNDKNPVFEGQHSPSLVLALFSKVLSNPQPDWPSQARVTGFCFYDKKEEVAGSGMSRELLEFLDAGPPPVVFTLGSSAVFGAGDFFQQSIEAVRRTGVRAVLLVGDARFIPPALPQGIAAFDYAPFSELLPRARAVVHQGGIGTTAQVMHAGKPMLVVPFSNDQPDNAARVERLGIARTIRRSRYKVELVARELKALLEDLSYTRRAEEVGRIVRSEDGPRAACDAIEEMLARRQQT